MRVAFYLDSAATAEQRGLLAKAMESVFAAMPKAQVMVIADEGPVPFALRRARAQAALGGETLFLDTDCQVRADLSHVWRDTFEIALPEIDDRNVRYTGGIVFTRCPYFWSRWATELEKAGDLAVKPLLQLFQRHIDDYDAAGMTVRRLPWQTYEFTPRHEGQDPGAAAVVHWRGPRKAWWR